MSDTPHQPNGREFDAARERIAVLETALTGLKELGEERDKRYGETHIADKEAVNAALAAAKEAVAAALAAAKEAVIKQEGSQTTYNASHNDLLKKMEQQYRDTLPRTEAEQRFSTLSDKINELRLWQSAREGGTMQQQQTRAQLNITTGQVLVVLAIIIGVIEFVLRYKP